MDKSDEGERFWNDLDWDDIVEAFIGSLAASLCVALLLMVLVSRGRRRRRLRRLSMR